MNLNNTFINGKVYDTRSYTAKTPLQLYQGPQKNILKNANKSSMTIDCGEATSGKDFLKTIGSDKHFINPVIRWSAVASLVDKTANTDHNFKVINEVKYRLGAGTQEMTVKQLDNYMVVASNLDNESYVGNRMLSPIASAAGGRIAGVGVGGYIALCQSDFDNSIDKLIPNYGLGSGMELSIKISDLTTLFASLTNFSLHVEYYNVIDEKMIPRPVAYEFDKFQSFKFSGKSLENKGTEPSPCILNGVEVNIPIRKVIIQSASAGRYNIKSDANLLVTDNNVGRFLSLIKLSDNSDDLYKGFPVEESKGVRYTILKDRAGVILDFEGMGFISKNNQLNLFVNGGPYNLADSALAGADILVTLVYTKVLGVSEDNTITTK